MISMLVYYCFFLVHKALWYAYEMYIYLLIIINIIIVIIVIIIVIIIIMYKRFTVHVITSM